MRSLLKFIGYHSHKITFHYVYIVKILTTFKQPNYINITPITNNNCLHTKIIVNNTEKLWDIINELLDQYDELNEHKNIYS